MEWQEPGIILGTRKLGEGSVIVEIFTLEHGRHMGVVRGGRGSRMRSILQPGNRVFATWRARLSDHLGQFKLEPDQLDAALFMDDRLRLLGLNQLNEQVRLLAEREPHPDLFVRYKFMLDTVLEGENWAKYLVAWEVNMLQELGFGLDLSACAATGDTKDLVYVSPKTGRAVSREAGLPYHDRMLILPKFLREDTEPDAAELRAGFALTDFFLLREIYNPRQIDPSIVREQLVDKLCALAKNAA
ncbi:MAG: DNA repair protein RecO [Rhizobiales bacterium]|nr:DNA repair protein RecO [Hyphomicrobiales bacterium]